MWPPVRQVWQGLIGCAAAPPVHYALAHPAHPFVRGERWLPFPGLNQSLNYLPLIISPVINPQKGLRRIFVNVQPNPQCQRPCLHLLAA